jgi:ABC-type antimicrobial peptide transport system permease subunit
MGAILGMIGSLPIVAYLHYNPISLANSKLGDIYSSMGIEPIVISALEPSVFVREFTIILIVALVLSFYPIYSISKLDPVEAMRS